MLSSKQTIKGICAIGSNSAELCSCLEESASSVGEANYTDCCIVYADAIADSGCLAEKKCFKENHEFTVCLRAFIINPSKSTIVAISLLLAILSRLQ